MARLAWTYDSWLGRWPSTGGDERYRGTLVLPWPFRPRLDEDGDRLYRALVVVTRPWWLCRDALRRDYRRWVRWERGLDAALADVRWEADDAEEQWSRCHDLYLAAAGARPAPPWS